MGNLTRNCPASQYGTLFSLFVLLSFCLFVFLPFVFLCFCLFVFCVFAFLSFVFLWCYKCRMGWDKIELDSIMVWWDTEQLSAKSINMRLSGCTIFLRMSSLSWWGEIVLKILKWDCPSSPVAQYELGRPVRCRRHFTLLGGSLQSGYWSGSHLFLLVFLICRPFLIFNLKHL